ncbi:MAG: FkbM family methyltransferase [Planctomycetes bacterium]|nr:FkbM family methyltransferase [Planctomycetota bacterium]
MQAYLFDDFKLEIDERATGPGHCWHGRYRDGIPAKLTSDLERFFYKLTLGYENPVVLDIGANDGVFSLIAAINQHIRCFAFEPAPSNYDILQRNIALNNLEGRVKTFQLALADKKGTAVLKVPSSGKNDGLACIGSPLRFENWVECEVPVSTVDDFLKDYGLDRVDLVKIDTEGCELLVLKGAQELIRRCHPNILLEYWEPNTKQFGYRPEEITKLLASLGYKHTMVGHEDRYFYMPKVAPVVKPTFGTANIKTSPRRNSEPADIRRCVDIAPRKLSPTLETFCTSNEIDSVNEVGEWIEQLASSQKRLYYRDQSVKSLSALVNLVYCHKPDKIVELGTLSGLSLRAWLLAKNNAQIDAEIIAVDLSFKPLLDSCAVVPLELSKVKLLEQDILKTDFSRLWSKEDRVILYVDVHDTPIAPIMAHILKNALSALPRGSVVAVDDLWYRNEPVSDGSVSKFLKEVAANEVDSLGCFDGYYAPYWKGGFFIGFPEVAPLMEWVNRNKIDLIFEPGNKVVMFECPASPGNAAGTDFSLEAFNRLTGNLHHNPVDQISVYEEKDVSAGQEAAALCRRGIEFFAVGRVQEALDCFNRAIGLTSNISGALCAIGICLVRLGRFDLAVKALESEVNGKCAHPNAQILYKDIKKYIAKEQGHISKQAQQRQLKGLTIFAMPKCFTGAFAAIQRNAVGSWMQLRPRPEIILLGDDDGVADFALRYGFKHIPSVQRNEFGTPLLDDLFLKAQAAASNEICVYVNSDIILMDDFAEALESVARRFGQFLMVGRRWDLDMSEEIDFYAEDWEQRLIERVRREGIYHAPTGIDYFAFKKGLWPAIPPLALGRGMWDNWLVREPLLAGQPVVDASNKVTIIHQNHGHSHISGGKEGASFNIELQRNLDLTGNDTSLAYTSHAAWELTPNGIALRPISEFLKENNFSAALKCIESAYQQAPDIVKEQFEALRLQVDPDCLSRLLPVARRELILGSAKNVAKLLLNSLETENRSAAEEFFRKGFQYLNDGNGSEAVKHLERAAMNCTTLPNLYYALAAAYAQLGDIFSAKRACQVELSLQPDNRGAAGLLERIDQAANEYRQSLIG